jgi:predicted ABC-type ATPase
MKLYVFAGANGSGKSTLVDKFFEKPSHENVNYVCPDDIVKAMPKTNRSIVDKYREAMRLAELYRHDLIKRREPLCLETVLSNPDKLDFILKAKNADYRVCIVYVTTQTPDINILRVKKRMSEGGHDVPEDKIISRYHKSMALIPKLMEVADEFYLYDNSTDDEKPKLVCCTNYELATKPAYEKYIKPYIKN